MIKKHTIVIDEEMQIEIDRIKEELRVKEEKEKADAQKKK